MVKAWIVLFIDLSTAPQTLRGAGIRFGEDPPIANGEDVKAVVLESLEADTYEAAAESAASAISSDRYAWIGELRESPTEGIYREPMSVESPESVLAWAKGARCTLEEELLRCEARKDTYGASCIASRLARYPGPCAYRSSEDGSCRVHRLAGGTCK